MINYDKHREAFPSVCFLYPFITPDYQKEKEKLMLYISWCNNKEKKQWRLVETLLSGNRLEDSARINGFVLPRRQKVQTCVKLHYQQGDFHTWKCIEIFHSVAWCSHLQIHPTHSPWVVPLLCGVRQLPLWLWVPFHSTFSGRRSGFVWFSSCMEGSFSSRWLGLESCLKEVVLSKTMIFSQT